MPNSPPPSPTIHEAARALDGTGRVFAGAQIDQKTAVARRQAGLDVVVCGENVAANRVIARDVEATVGPYARGDPHLSSAGPQALPHYQQQQPPPVGHSFYETPHRKAKKKP